MSKILAVGGPINSRKGHMLFSFMHGNAQAGANMPDRCIV